MREPGGWIGTHTGTKFWPLEPFVTEIYIADIAHSLARQCRFNGHCKPFYSVAEHSIEVSCQVPLEFALWGLLHDAAETYLSDIVRPLKSRCVYSVPDCGIITAKTYRECEEELLEAVALRFGLVRPMPDEIGFADDRMLATERQQLFDERQPHWDGLNGVEPYPIVLRCMECGLVEKMFLLRFEELIGYK
jgi:hypothetical protein